MAKNGKFNWIMPKGWGDYAGQVERHGVVQALADYGERMPGGITVVVMLPPSGHQPEPTMAAQTEDVESMPGLERAMEAPRPLQGSEAL